MDIIATARRVLGIEPSAPSDTTNDKAIAEIKREADRDPAPRFSGHPDDYSDADWATYCAWSDRDSDRKARIKALTPTPADKPFVREPTNDLSDPEPTFSGHPDDWSDADWATWCAWRNRNEARAEQGA